MRFSPTALIRSCLAAAVIAAAPACAPVGAPIAAPPAAAAAQPRVMVAAANPMAVEAGVEMLRAGGGAVDAAVAIQAVLGLVEPQSSGIGGGAFLLHYEARTGRVTAYDGRETAPAGADARMFLHPDGRPMSYAEAVVSGRATGVPGAVAMLQMAHRDHGRRPWAALFAGPIRLAEAGFPVPGRLARFIASNAPQAATPDATAYFTRPEGGRYGQGETLRNPAYAATLRRIAAEGAEGLLAGPVAARIAAKVAEDPRPGTLTTADMAAYRPRRSEALCRPYRAYRICTPQAPSGGPAVLELMGLLARTDIDRRGPADPRAWLQFAEASRLAYADRDQYVADPAFTAVPVEGLLDPAYLDARARLIGERAAPRVAPGRPRGAPALAADRTLEPAGTSSFAVADADGNVVVMTTTVESLFGTGRMVDGFFLNNQLTDFSFSPVDAEGRPVANAVAPGKRPRSSMAPTLVLDGQGRFVMAVGSPGGPAIIAYVAKALVGALDWGLPLQDAVALPNLVARGDGAGAESSFDPAALQALEALGLRVTPGRGEESGLHGVAMTPRGLVGAADPRREGAAAGF